MRTVSGLGALVAYVRTFFSTFATVGAIGTVTVTGGGSSVITVSGTPASDYSVRIEFGLDAAVGVDPVQYRESLDGGLTFGPVKMTTAFSFLLLNSLSGVVVNLGVGTIMAGQVVTFTTEGPRKTAPILFGWRESYKQINQGAGGANRIVFTPGDDSGRDGPMVGVMRPGHRQVTAPPTDNTSAGQGALTRPLWDWQRVALVSVWAVDPAQPQNDAANIEAVERLLEDVIQAVQAIAVGVATWGAPIWTTPIESQFGKEIRIPLHVRTQFFDLPQNTVTPTSAINRDPAA